MATSMYNWYATQPTVYLLAGYPRYAMIATCEIFIPQLEFGPEVVWLRERVCSHTLGWCRGPGGLEEAGETWLVSLKLGHIPPNHSAMIVFSHWPLEIMHLSLETFWGPLSVIDRDQDCANIVTTDVQPWTGSLMVATPTCPQVECHGKELFVGFCWTVACSWLLYFLPTDFVLSSVIHLVQPGYHLGWILWDLSIFIDLEIK